ncbi:MAG: histidine--tRNA ligase [Magnetococcales bacterium]|nr:histidine--tRNA ligase [Magnetococcales bacterium]
MIQTARGVRDILPEEAEVWHFLEETAITLFGLYGYQEVRTPLFEKSGLFSRAVGETTDIVEKEMYTFTDRGGESLSLRPEGTASVVRAFLEAGLTRQLPWRVCYRGPMFRYERPQKGRYRQFHQLGCELLGPAGPLADAEQMAMILDYLRRVGLGEGLTLEINSLGCGACRPGYREGLVGYLRSVPGDAGSPLCENCRRRLRENPLRVLDCKLPECRAVAARAPVMRDHLCPPCADHFRGLVAELEGLALPYVLNPLMVRGLDYYTRTAFEVTTTRLGAQNAVAAGGRYDSLVAQLGGPEVPAIGFAMGLERLALLLAESPRAAAAPAAYVVAVGEAAELLGARVAASLRGAGLRVVADLMGGSMKSQMKRADRSGAPVTLILGEEEAAKGQVMVKNMAARTQRILAWEEVLPYLDTPSVRGG